MSNEKTVFVIKSTVEPTSFFIEKKKTFSLKLFSGHFYGQSFIKTVRGPLIHRESEFFPLRVVPCGMGNYFNHIR